MFIVSSGHRFQEIFVKISNTVAAFGLFLLIFIVYGRNNVDQVVVAATALIIFCDICVYVTFLKKQSKFNGFSLVYTVSFLSYLFLIFGIFLQRINQTYGDACLIFSQIAFVFYVVYELQMVEMFPKESIPQNKEVDTKVKSSPQNKEVGTNTA